MKVIITFILLTTLSPLAFAQPNTLSVTIDTVYNVPFSIDYGYGYLSGWDDLTPIITTYIDHTGTISVCSVDTNARETYIYEYTQDLRPIKTIKVSNEFEKLGAFVKDEDGNYYILSAEDVQEGAFNQKNIVITKYDSEGEKINAFYLIAQTSDEIWARGFSGIKRPFYAGSCRMEISGDWIAVYFARQMFRARDGKNHQASYGFILDKNTLEKIRNISMPSAGHSFNQYILPIENGFIFADQGDYDPRGFNFTKVQNGKSNKILKAFTFKKSRTYQYTFAQLGGLAKTSGGYIFAGTYEKNTVVSHESHNDSRNLFVLTIDEDFTSCSKPIWITAYADTNNKNAASPKIVSLEDGRYLLMWEYMVGYIPTIMQVIDESGNPLGDAVELPGIRLNRNDVLRYNRHNGKVYWAVNDGNKSIIVYALEVH